MMRESTRKIKCISVLCLLCLAKWMVADAEKTPAFAEKEESLGEFEERRRNWLARVQNYESKPAMVIDSVLRLKGSSLVPFTVYNQKECLQSANETVVKQLGNLEIFSYREGIADPNLNDPDSTDEMIPYVDIYGRAYGWRIEKYASLFQPDSVNANESLDNSFPSFVTEGYSSIMQWGALMREKGVDVEFEVLSLNPVSKIMELPVPPLIYMFPMYAYIFVRLNGSHAQSIQEAHESSNSSDASQANYEDTFNRKLLSFRRRKKSIDSYQEPHFIRRSMLSNDNSWISEEDISFELTSLSAPEASAVEVILSDGLYGWASTSVRIEKYNSRDIYDDMIINKNLVHFYESPDVERLRTLPDEERLSSGLLKVELMVPICPSSQQIVESFSEQSYSNSGLSYDCERRGIIEAMTSVLIGSSSFIHNASIIALQDRPIGKDYRGDEAILEKAVSEGDSKILYHLDALDQHELPYDGKYNATADGTGVHVYLISSGVYAEHIEFGFRDGSSGNRIIGSWGVSGSNPLEDCPDGSLLYYFGTYAASIIAGKTVGVAPNATIHSVRMRKNCILESPDGSIWSPGGLPSAIDSILSTFKRPGIIVVDTWWSPDRLLTDDDVYIERAILERLEIAAEMDIPIIVPAGMTIGGLDPCDNIFTKGKSAIKVGAVDLDRHISFYSSDKCVDLFATTGSLGNFMTGASAENKNAYKVVSPQAFGASWIVAGIAAQHMQINPSYTAAELKSAILGNATRDSIIGLSSNSNNYLAYTDLKSDNIMSANASDASLSTTGIVLVSVLIPLTIGALLLVIFVRIKRGKRISAYGNKNAKRNTCMKKNKPLTKISIGDEASEKIESDTSSEDRTRNPSLDTIHDWEILPSQITISCHPDGSLCVLGAGRWGTVYRGLKDGIQQVAIKTLKLPYEPQLNTKKKSTDDTNMIVSQNQNHTFDQGFAREIAMMRWLSRDANIVQFFGASLDGQQLMLVTELMEGGDLRKALTEDKDGSLRWYKNGKRIAMDIARGLHFLHSHAVVHRDIKSKNVLLSHDYRAKIADVGVAHVLPTDTKSESHDKCIESEEVHPAVECGCSTSSKDFSTCDSNTSSGFVGTFAWAAPEILLNSKITTKADMYSFGVVLFEIATGEIPLRGRIHLPSVPDDCPQEIVDLMEACMSIDVGKRPTAKEAYEILERCK